MAVLTMVTVGDHRVSEDFVPTSPGDVKLGPIEGQGENGVLLAILVFFVSHCPSLCRLPVLLPQSRPIPMPHFYAD